MSHILYIHQYFKTPKEPGGTRSYWISRELIKRGHKVTVLTTSNRIKKKREEVVIDGINVIYLKVNYDQKMSVLRRLLSFVIFMIKSSYYAVKINSDVIYATSTPLTVGVPPLIAKTIKRTPYIFEVRDLWPEVPIQMGGLKSPFLIKITRSLEKTIYRRAKHIIALSPGMKDGVTKYVSEKKVSMIPNMAKIDFFFPREKNIKKMSELGLKEDSFKIIHFGSLGLANGVDTIIESAKYLKEDDSIEFVFIGGGAIEKQLIEKCEKENISNVKFLGSFSMKETSEIVNFCDLSIVSFLDLPILYTNSPNKLFDSLSAGKAIIVNSAGWTKDLVEENRCGYYVNPNESKELVDKIKYLQQNPDELNRMSKSSRNIAEKVYDKSILCEKVRTVVNSYL